MHVHSVFFYCLFIVFNLFINHTWCYKTYRVIWKLNDFFFKHPRVASVPATMSCLNICLPNPKLLINFIYLLKEIRNVIFGLNKSCSEFWVLSLDHLCHMMWTESCNWIKELYTWRSWCMPRSLFNNGDIARISMASRTLRSNHLASQSNILGASLPFIISTWSVVSIYVMHVLCLGIFSHIAELE